jgi:hypothetical protein
MYMYVYTDVAILGLELNSRAYHDSTNVIKAAFYCGTLPTH